MDPDTMEEGAYDAPLDQAPSNSTQFEDSAPSNAAAERQARLERVRQRRAELTQNRSPVSSNLTQTSPMLPTTSKAVSSSASAAPDIPIRADTVKEAVEFLTNPRVASAPTATKRRFLTERKGLTEAEADEAFRRAETSPTPQSAPTQKSIAPSPPQAPQYYGPPVVYQPQPLVPAGPSLKSIALVVVLGVGAASLIIHLFKKYIWSYWFPRKSPLSEKIDFLESKLQAAHELISTQAAETKEAMVVLRAFLESQVTDWQERQRLEALKSTQDEKALSDLKREVSSVRHLIPSVGTLSRTAKASVMQSDVLEDIKNELASLKNAVKGITAGVPSGPSLLRLSSAPASTAVVESSPAVPELFTESTAPSTASPSSTTSTSGANPLSASASKRALPSWMQQPKALPSWQMQDKSAESTSTPTTPEPAPEASSSPAAESKPVTETPGTV